MDPTVLTKNLMKKHYIHVNSDHPPSILTQLPMSVEKMIINFIIVKVNFRKNCAIL